MTSGRIQSPMPERFLLNCQGIAKPTQGKSSSVVLIPRFDGFKKWTRRPCTGNRNTYLEPIAVATAKATMISRSLKYSNMAIDRAAMWADNRKSTSGTNPPAYRGRRP